MPTFSERSKARLATCHPDLQRLMQKVIERIDVTVLVGHRGEEEQNEAYRKNQSRLQFPNSKHNSIPSKAIDIAPYIPGRGIDWNYTPQFYLVAGIVLATAAELKIPIRWGGDFNRNLFPGDEKFLDLVHFELEK